MSHFGSVVIDPVRCLSCGLCTRDCLRRCLTPVPGGPPVLDPARCFRCGHCVAICPTGAASVTGAGRSEQVEKSAVSSALDPDTLLNCIKLRRSVRQFSPRPVDRALIDRILEAGRYTPTGSNRQDVSYIVVAKDLARLEEAALADCRAEGRPDGRQAWLPLYTPDPDLSPGYFFRGASAAILVLSEQPVNAALASANMELMAVSLGLGVCYIGLYVRAVQCAPHLQQELGIAPPRQLITCLALGHPAVEYCRSVPRNPVQAEFR